MFLSIRETGTVQDYGKTCTDASPVVVQKMAYAAALKGWEFSANVKQTHGGGAASLTIRVGKRDIYKGNVQEAIRGTPIKGVLLLREFALYANKANIKIINADPGSTRMEHLL